MVLVDSSVWIHYFNGAITPETDTLDALLGQDLLLMGDLILTEVLQGFRDNHFDALEIHLGLRRFLSKNIPACWSVRPPSVLRQPLQSPLCAGWRAWKANEHPAHSGISFSGNRLKVHRGGVMG